MDASRRPTALNPLDNASKKVIIRNSKLHGKANPKCTRGRGDGTFRQTIRQKSGVVGIGIAVGIATHFHCTLH